MLTIFVRLFLMMLFVSMPVLVPVAILSAPFLFVLYALWRDTE